MFHYLHVYELAGTELDIMDFLSIAIQTPIRPSLARDKFALVPAHVFHVSEGLETAQQALWRSWEHLKLDAYLKEGDRYRLRRFSLFSFSPDSEQLVPLSRRSYYQGKRINSYAGGIAREFEEMTELSKSNPFLHALVRFDFRQLPIDTCSEPATWEVDIHQIRVTATTRHDGYPTPEGIHRDGEDFVVVHFVAARNISGGRSTVYDNQHVPLLHRTLSEPLDSIFLWDQHVLHSVDPITIQEIDQPAFRDVLLISFTRGSRSDNRDLSPTWRNTRH